MTVSLRPGPVSGCITAPPSKSMAHRAVLAAALAEGTSRIRNVQLSQDVQATLAAARAMGAGCTVEGDCVTITGHGLPALPAGPVDCGESGSTLRFLIPVLSLAGGRVRLTGHGRLPQRPQTVYEDIFKEQGLYFAQDDGGLVIEGRLSPGAYAVPGNVSSQFISGLLFALPLLAEPSTLRVLPPFESRPYVDMTLSALRDCGVRVQWDAADPELLHIPAPQRYAGRDCAIEGDYSQAAFFAVLGALAGGVRIRGLRRDSLQGDAAILDILRRCGAAFCWEQDVLCFEKRGLHAAEIDLAPCPDLGPVLMALAMFCRGTTVIRNAGRLRLKESDRIAAMQQELAKFGAQVEADGGTVRITGCTPHAPGPLCGHNDHRVVMSLAVAAAAGGWPVTIEGAGAVRKSWPEFFEVLETVGTEAEDL